MSELTDRARAKLEQYAPTAGVAVVAAAIAARLSIPDAPEIHALPELPQEVQRAQAQPRRSAEKGVATRVVSCGNSQQAKVTGDDLVGVVDLGGRANGGCTVLFASRWAAPPTCVLEGATLVSVNETDLVVSGVDGAFAYRCAP